jgi:hypothetical protein
LNFDLLLRIVGRIGEDPGVEAMFNPITATYHNSMFACFYKLVIQHDLPLFMKQFSVAVCHKVSARAFASEVLCSEILEAIWKLRGNVCMSMAKAGEYMSTYMVEICDMIA